MEKETLLNGLRSVIGEPDTTGNYKELGITDRTLDAYLGAIAPTIGDDVADDFYQSQVTVLKAMGGQLRHEQAEFVKSYKGNNPPPPSQKPKDVPGDNQPEYLKELSNGLKTLLEENKELKSRLDRIDKNNVQSKLKTQVIGAMREAGADDDYVLETTMRGIELDEKKSVEELTKEHLARYDKEFKSCRGEGAVPRETVGGGKRKTAIDDYFSKKWQK